MPPTPKKNDEDTYIQSAKKRKKADGAAQVSGESVEPLFVAPTFDDGDNLIPLSSTEPNVFYGYGDGLMALFEAAEEESGEGLFFHKHGVMQALSKAQRRDAKDNQFEDGDNDDEGK